MLAKVKYYIFTKQFTLDELIQFLLTFALIIVPAFFIPNRELIDPYSQPRFMMLLIIAVLFILIFISQPKKFIMIFNRNKTINFLVLIYIFILTVSLTYSVDLNLSLFGFHIWKDGFVVQIIYFTLFFAAQMCFVFDKKLLVSITVIGVIIAIYGIMQNFGIDFMRDSNFTGLPVSANMYNQNFLGSYLVLMLPISLCLYLVYDRVHYLLYFIIQFYALLGTLTRGAWLGFIFTIVTLMVLVLIKKFRIRKCRSKTINLLVLIFLAMLIFNLFNENVLFSRFISIFNDVGGLISGENIINIGSYRGYIWSKTLNYIAQRPLEGYGIQNIMLYFLSDYLKEMYALFGDVIIVNNVHNEYMQIAVSTGIPSLIIIAIATFKILIKGLKNISLDSPVLPIYLAIIGYLVQYFFSLSFISNTFILYIMLGSVLTVKYDINSSNKY